MGIRTFFSKFPPEQFPRTFPQTFPTKTVRQTSPHWIIRPKHSLQTFPTLDNFPSTLPRHFPRTFAPPTLHSNQLSIPGWASEPMSCLCFSDTVYTVLLLAGYWECIGGQSRRQGLIFECQTRRILLRSYCKHVMLILFCTVYVSGNDCYVAWWCNAQSTGLTIERDHRLIPGCFTVM